MKLILCCVAVVTVLGGSAWAQDGKTVDVLTTSNAGPRLALTGELHNFGKIGSGQVVSHEFVFTNTGSITLKILAIETSCGCTTVGEVSREVAPGGTGTITLQMNSAGFKGVVTKATTIVCNDQQQPRRTLTLTGEFWNEVELLPSALIMRGNNETLPQLKTVARFLNHGAQFLLINGLESDNPAFVPVIKTNVPGKEYEVSVSLDPHRAPPGYGTIKFRTSLTNRAEFVIPVLLYVEPVITTSPSELVLDLGSSTNLMALRVRIQNHGTNRLILSRPVSSPAAVPVTLTEIEAGITYDLECDLTRVRAQDLSQLLELSVATDRADTPQIRIPIRPPPASR